MTEIRMAQFMKLEAGSVIHRYQNYFINTTYKYLSEEYLFAPFQAGGTVASLNGDNEQLTILFPAVPVAVQLLSQADGNRLSKLTLTNAWLDGSNKVITTVANYYTGSGSSVSDTTIELRYRSAADAVGALFPARTLTRALVGPLPLNSELYLR